MPIRKEPIITGQYYQVVNRGFLKRIIFKKEEDFKVFFKLIDAYGRGVDIVSCALIPNHFHLVLKQKMDRGIEYLMSNVQRLYSKYFSESYGKVGTLYEGRFFSERIKDEKHMQNVLKYVFENPTKHKLIKLGKDGISGINFME